MWHGMGHLFPGARAVKKFHITVWHGESRSLFYAVRSDAPNPKGFPEWEIEFTGNSFEEAVSYVRKNNGRLVDRFGKFCRAGIRRL
jgi:hypothetical protein